MTTTLATTPDALAPGKGLTTAEANVRRASDGSNGIEDVKQNPVLRALSKLWAPVPWMLEAAIVFQLVLGEYPEAAVVGLLLLFNGGLSFYQEGRAQTTLAALRSQLALTSSVLRDGKWVTIAAADLVLGDVVTLSLGTVVPADVRILRGSILVDQSMLTGESLPVEAGAGIVTYAGSLVRRGESTAEVLQTGSRTRFGRGAELIRTAHVESSEQKAIFRVVRNLGIFNGGMTVLLVAYAFVLKLPLEQIGPLAVVAVVASIPVALPSMFTLAATIGARALARRGVLPTRLSALDEAAGVDVLVVDKTGTLTLNSLAVAQCIPEQGFTQPQVLGLAALASSTAGADPVDAAVRKAASARSGSTDLTLVEFHPFDPTAKMSSATATNSHGKTTTVVKGAFAVVAALSSASDAASASSQTLEKSGYRVLAVAVGTTGSMTIAGLIALSDPPRAESKSLIQRLSALGIRTIMATGDAAGTAKIVAAAVGITGTSSTVTPLAADTDIDHIGIYAGVLPEDKFALVKMLQTKHHQVAMVGDGVNDAPALKQAQMGVAVLSASDIAKSAAGIILTNPGLEGIIAAVEEGRSTFQRILTYTLRSVTRKVVQVLFLLAGLILTGHAIITPVLMVIMMISGDFLAMSSSTDRVRPSPSPSIWRIGNLTITSVVLGICNLSFCVGVLAIGRSVLHLGSSEIQTLAAVTLVFTGQSVFYVARERRHLWSSRPSKWVLLSSAADLGIITILATFGFLMTPLPLRIIGVIAAACIGLAFALDAVKLALFRRLKLA